MLIAEQLWIASGYTLELQVGSLAVNDRRGRRLTPIDDICKVGISRPVGAAHKIAVKISRHSPRR